MAEIKINNLNANPEQSEQVIDLRKEATTNSEAFAAFVTLRGGSKSTCWSS